MLAAVEDVQHRHGQRATADPAQIAVERQSQCLCGTLGHGQRHAQDSVGSQFGLVGGAIQFDEVLVNGGLLQRIPAPQFLGDRQIHVFYGFEHPFAAEATCVAVSQFHRFVHAGGNARRHGGPAHRPAAEQDFDLHSGIATGIQYLSSDDLFNQCHDLSPDVRLFLAG